MYQEFMFPSNVPQYLTEQMFTEYGFYTGTARNLQIQAAFLAAERQVAREIRTYLLPTVVTGSLSAFRIGDPIYLPQGMVNEVLSVVFYERSTDGTDTLISGTGYILDRFYGSIVLHPSQYDSNTSYQYCRDGQFVLDGQSLGVYRAEVAYNAGYPSGTWSDPNITLAICQAADIMLKMLRDEGELPDEDAQFIKQYSIGRYSQSVEAKWAQRTNFGFSGRAQFISNLLEPWKIKRAHALGR